MRAWLKYRDVCVNSETYPTYSKKKYYSCMADLTMQRVARMKDMLEFMRDDFDGKGPYGYADSAKDALQKIHAMENRGE
jgi:hypothetical protein